MPEAPFPPTATITSCTRDGSDFHSGTHLEVSSTQAEHLFRMISWSSPEDKVVASQVFALTQSFNKLLPQLPVLRLTV